MSTVLRPVGSQPARVYWIRRVLILLGLVVVGVLVWAFVVSGQGDATSQDPGQEVPAQGSEEDQEPAPAGMVACTAADLTLTLVSDARTYPEDARPVFTIGYTNTGPQSCTVDTGPAGRDLLITSGADRIWSSTDCEEEGGERLLLLQPGEGDVAEVTWDRTRSDEACSEGLPEPRPGTYSATVGVLGAQSAAAVFDLG
ncbi:hypothetical protein [Actinotalea sp. K2]|uniref:hypothetical protein n=1 Tax=Actinotalea sp. K2 TaxID=2939438 RepID=UPI0020174AE2|nr:hypothetical protein [Actinotalea sp. K2]MCL3863092.1 hypothetical protein [Actinotalea sp. K2]